MYGKKSSANLNIKCTIHNSNYTGVSSNADADVMLDETEVQRKTGRPLKLWSSLNPRQKRNLSQAALNEVNKVADARNTQPEVIIGSLLHRYRLSI